MTHPGGYARVCLSMDEGDNMATHATLAELRARVLYYYGTTKDLDKFELSEEFSRRLLAIDRHEDFDTSVYSVAPVAVSIVEGRLVVRLLNKQQSKRQNTSDIVKVFDYWVEATGRNGTTMLTKQRRAAVRDRLKDGYTVERIKQAIDYVARSKWHQGQNDRGKKYDDLAMVCRNATKLEEYADKRQGMKTMTKQETTLPAQYQHMEDDDGELEL